MVMGWTSEYAKSLPSENLVDDETYPEPHVKTRSSPYFYQEVLQHGLETALEKAWKSSLEELPQKSRDWWEIKLDGPIITLTKYNGKSPGVPIDTKIFTEVGQPTSSIPNVGIHRHSWGTRRSRYAGIVAQWLKDCVDNHQCQKVDSSLPTRVLDVSRASKDCVFLHVSHNQIAPYAALSHCWGGEVLMKTTSQNYESRKNHLSLSDLPQNFQNAVAVTISLGLQYLWIDAICIIQDDPSDWDIESRNMGDVYGGAHIVIGADSACNSMEGFLDDDPSICTKRSVVPVAKIEDERTLVYATKGLFHFNSWSLLENNRISGLKEPTAKDNPLAKRAWTFQEQILARRMLHFAKVEIIWECKSEFRCECMELDGSYEGIIKGDWWSSMPNKFEMWYRIVNTVCKRDITFASDLLPCISGLARQMHSSEMGDYLAGLWSNDLLLGLCWNAPAGDRLPLYQAPSWSWASLSWRTTPYYQLELRESYGLKVSYGRILKAKCTPRGTNAFGPVSDGYIKICVPVNQVLLLPLAGYSWKVEKLDNQQQQQQQQQDRLFHADSDTKSELPQDVSYFAILLAEEHWAMRDQVTNSNQEGQVVEIYGLILQRCSTKAGQTYKRIGSFSSGGNDELNEEIRVFFQDAKEETIILV
ncbi:MAG: hypothetical protein LQ342_007185 [Letrouitia transgressa]|nr:MAG: hypothetical protein LQ342_007185 [Letrouitia transgressa]